jgi:CCR4-NOT transcription complex subunit 4
MMSQLLRKPEYFGQYGKIKKIVVNRKIGESTGRPDSACAYITFTCREDAECAIRALDGFTYNGRVIK